MKTIEVITLQVKDQQKAKEYYLQLGFEVIAEAPMGNGETWLQMGLPGQTTSIALLNFGSIILETVDMENEISELKAGGIEVSEVDNTPWGKFAQLKDVDGNALTLHQK